MGDSLCAGSQALDSDGLRTFCSIDARKQTPEIESKLPICDQSVTGAEVETRLVLHAPVPVHAKPESPFSIRVGGMLHRSLALKPLAVFPVDRETSIFIPSHAR